MADFCYQCTERVLGMPGGQNDLKGISTEKYTAQNMFANTLCGGCGPNQVDHLGRCVTPDCLEKHGSCTPPEEMFLGDGIYAQYVEECNHIILDLRGPTKVVLDLNVIEMLKVFNSQVKGYQREKLDRAKRAKDAKDAKEKTTELEPQANMPKGNSHG